MEKQEAAVQAALARRKMSQAALARAIGMSPAWTSNMVRGHFTPLLAQRRAISKALRCPQRNLWPDAGRE